MNIEELNEWLETEEGAKWLDEQKAPLLKKRDELLEANKALRADLSRLKTEADGQREVAQREQNALKRVLIDDRLEQLAEQYGVFPQLRNALRSELEERGLEIVSDGDRRKAVVGPDQKELSEYMAEWSHSEEADGWLKPPVHKGAGVTGAGPELSDADSEATRYAAELAKHLT